jgi:hypothetical protein
VNGQQADRDLVPRCVRTLVTAWTPGQAPLLEREVLLTNPRLSLRPAGALARLAAAVSRTFTGDTQLTIVANA